MSEKKNVKIAAVQMEPKLMETTENLNRMKSMTREAASKGADLIVFPECGLTGYVFTGRTEAIPYAETVPGPSSEELARLCRELQVFVMYGLFRYLYLIYRRKAGDDPTQTLLTDVPMLINLVLWGACCLCIVYFREQVATLLG